MAHRFKVIFFGVNVIFTSFFSPFLSRSLMDKMVSVFAIYLLLHFVLMKLLVCLIIRERWNILHEIDVWFLEWQESDCNKTSFQKRELRKWVQFRFCNFWSGNEKEPLRLSILSFISFKWHMETIDLSDEPRICYTVQIMITWKPALCHWCIRQPVHETIAQRRFTQLCSFNRIQ